MSDDQSSSQECPEVAFIHRNGGVVLLSAGYQYAKKNEYQNGSSAWRCVNWRRKKCKAILTLKDDTILKVTDHRCEPNETSNKLALKLDEFREKVLTSNAPIPDMYKELTAELKDSDLHLLKKLPAFGNLKSTMYNARKKDARLQKMQFFAPEVTNRKYRSN